MPETLYTLELNICNNKDIRKLVNLYKNLIKDEKYNDLKKKNRIIINNIENNLDDVSKLIEKIYKSI